MLAYVLAIVIAIESFSFYMAAFFVPEIHRRQDFFWSGLGMFYAVVLWFCAGRITGAVLLGQTASVALLGWLGWQTLALRRSLTPEAVQTPVTWDDLQRWGSEIQQQVGQYIKLGSVLTSIQAIWADVSQAISALRNRTAGPRGVDVSSDVPPLKRSPAYEFETAPGKGQAVSSEFATVATRSLEQTADSVPLETDPRTQAVPSVQTAETVSDSECQKTGTEEDVDAGVSVTKAASHPSDVPQPQSKSIRSETADPKSVDTGESSAATRPRDRKPVASRTSVQSTKEGMTKTVNPVTGAAGWLGDVAKSFRKPKPQRAVIEIPPRPPSIPRSPEETATSPKTPPQPSTASGSLQAGKNWVDVGDVEDGMATSSIPPVPVRSAEVRVENVPSPSDLKDIHVDNQPQATPEDTNWPDDDIPENAPEAAQPAFLDEEDTNWPD